MIFFVLEFIATVFQWYLSSKRKLEWTKSLDIWSNYQGIEWRRVWHQRVAERAVGWVIVWFENGVEPLDACTESHRVTRSRSIDCVKNGRRKKYRSTNRMLWRYRWSFLLFPHRDYGALITVQEFQPTMILFIKIEYADVRHHHCVITGILIGEYRCQDQKTASSTVQNIWGFYHRAEEWSDCR